jgi:phytanoyl-CoA hydroxylase
LGVANSVPKRRCDDRARPPRFHEIVKPTHRADANPQHRPRRRTMLSPEQRRLWHDNGYLVLPGFKPAAAVAAAVAQANALVEAFEPSAATGTFSSVDRSRVRDEALLASAEAVHCFFEAEAFDAEGRLCVPKSRSINKIGHALHELDPVFSAFSHGPELAALAAALGLIEPKVWQSMLIFKQPHIGGEVGWHQDASFFVTEPMSVTAFWFALEDATLDNGCLWVQPGGHRGRHGVLRERYVAERSAAGTRLVMQPLDPTPWPAIDAGAVPLPVAAGTLVCFSGLLPHYSKPNRSARSRIAYTLHATDGRAAYSRDNWLQRSAALPVRGFQS